MEIKDLPDAELVRCVAIEVMPERWMDAYPAWSPLTSWDDAMMVVDRTAEWPYCYRKLFNKIVMGDNWYADIDKREILEAALEAVRKGDA